MSASSDSDLAAELRALEIALATRDLDALPGGVERVIDEAFVEFGASGRRWTYDEMVGALRGMPRTEAAIADFEVAMLSRDVVLVTYVIGPAPGQGGRISRRSSIWVRSEDGWRLRFHQGTATGS